MAKKDWNPESTKVLVLGLGLEDWEDPEDSIGHRDIILHNFFKKQGVPDANNVHFGNENGDRDSLLEFLPDFLSDSDENTFFIFYYAGHGDLVEDDDSDMYFCHPDEENCDSLTFSELIEVIEEYFNGNNVLFLADCCFSGVIADYVREEDTDYNYAALTSALSDKTSTGAWTFTDCVLEGLRGKALLDKDENNLISLEEIAKYVKYKMAKEENQKADFGYTEEFDTEMALAVAK
jgi:uncharacterized caspase-like protein